LAECSSKEEEEGEDSEEERGGGGRRRTTETATEMGSLQIENVCKGYGDLRLFNEMRDRERQKFIYTSMDGLLYSPSASPSAALSSSKCSHFASWALQYVFLCLIMLPI
jgi:hypothetical protein